MRSEESEHLMIIGSVLDQAQKLFSRSFAIAGFLPSLVFLMASTALCLGSKPVVDAWDKLDTMGLDKASFKTVLVLGVVYLLAYVVYGIRSALHQVFQGDWPFPLRWLSRLFLMKERWIWNRQMRRLTFVTDLTNVPKWVLNDEDRFGKDYSRSSVVLGRGRARVLLEQTREDLRTIVRELKEFHEPSSTICQRILLNAHALRANRHRFGSAFRDEVDRFLAELKARFEADQTGTFRKAARDLDSSTERDRIQAKGDFVVEFPEQSRWLRATRLGNVAVVQELYVLDRYGIPLGDLWPRLLPLLSADTTKQIDEAKSFLDFTVIMAFYSFLSVPAVGYSVFHGPLKAALGPLKALLLARSSGPLLAVLAHPTWIKILITLTPCLIGLMFYNLAIQATRGLGLQMQTAVDLYRLKLIDALGLVRPKTLEEERKIWRGLWLFFVEHLPLDKDIQYKPQT
jgi:hypothetical protein